MRPRGFVGVLTGSFLLGWRGLADASQKHRNLRLTHPQPALRWE